MNDENITLEGNEEPETVEQPQAEEVKAEAKEPSKKDKKKLQKKTEELEKALAKSEEALKEANDKYLRMLAEFDNFKKRTAKEQESTYTGAYLDAVKELLPVFDNLERAVEFASDEGSKNGLVLIVKSFIETLGKMGIEQYGERGDEFNADIHTAVMHTEDPELGECVISAVYQKGYKKGDKVIRYAAVTVAN